MAYLGSWKIDDAITFYANTHRFDTGAATDADSAPSYRVYEDETATPILTGSMALLDSTNTAGFYSEQITLSAANGLEKGKSYSIYISATVNSVTGTTHHTFQIEAEVDANTVSGTVTPAANSITASTIANDAITAAKIATGAIDADAIASDAITAAKIAADAITSAKVAAGALVYDDQITTFKSEISGLVVALPNGHITSAKIGADALGSDKFAPGCLVYGDQITEFDASIRSAASVAWGAAASTVRVYPADGALSAAVFAADCITSAKVAVGAFTYDDQITTFKSELSGMVVSLPDGHITAAKIGADAITSAKVAAGAFTYDDQITTFKSELSGVYTRLTTQGVRDITQYTSAHVSAFPGSSPALYDALLWNYSMHGYKRVQQPTSFVIYDAAGSTKIASATVSGTSAEVVIGTFQ